MYLAFEEYTKIGGTAIDEAAFALLEKRAEYKLDFYTQDRVKALNPVPDCVKDCMVEIINTISQQGEKISSFSNDGVSVSFEKSNDGKKLYQTIVEMLPAELVYVGAG